MKSLLQLALIASLLAVPAKAEKEIGAYLSGEVSAGLDYGNGFGVAAEGRVHNGRFGVYAEGKLTNRAKLCDSCGSGSGFTYLGTVMGTLHYGDFSLGAGAGQMGFETGFENGDKWEKALTRPVFGAELERGSRRYKFRFYPRDKTANETVGIDVGWSNPLIELEEVQVRVNLGCIKFTNETSGERDSGCSLSIGFGKVW